MEREKIKITIEAIQGGFYVDSRDLPTLNLFVKEESMLTVAIPEAIKYLYKHNRKLDVLVFMQVPVFETPAPAENITKELEVDFSLAA